MLGTVSLKRGFARVMVRNTADGGLCIHLVGPSGLPQGRTRTFGPLAARELAASFKECRTNEARHALVWASLGYGTKDGRALARTIGHPGGLPVQGRP